MQKFEWKNIVRSGGSIFWGKLTNNVNSENQNNPMIKRVQLFKSKPILASVQFALAEYLQQNHQLDKNDTLELFRIIGRPIDINKECKDTPEDFNLNNYPLKQAFDYAWENLAKAKHHQNIDFPKQQCIDHLKKYEVDTNNNFFKLYADLLYIRENLATLEHGDPHNLEQIKKKNKRYIFYHGL